jgi:hypothetical protein
MSPRDPARPRLWKRTQQLPFQLLATAVSVPIGIAALSIGTEVSTAMSRVLSGQIPVVRLWGLLMLAGGGCATYGRLAHRLGLERTGLRVLAPAYALYAGSVLLGLGKGGLVTGPMFFALALACYVRLNGALREEALAELLRERERE